MSYYKNGGVVCVVPFFLFFYYYLIIYFLVISYSLFCCSSPSHCPFALVVLVVNPVVDYAATCTRYSWYAE